MIITNIGGNTNNYYSKLLYRAYKSLHNLELDSWFFFPILILICVLYINFQTLKIVCVFPKYFYQIHAFMPFIVLAPCWSILVNTFLFIWCSRDYLTYEILLLSPVIAGRVDYLILIVWIIHTTYYNTYHSFLHLTVHRYLLACVTGKRDHFHFCVPRTQHIAGTKYLSVEGMMAQDLWKARFW